MVEQVKAEERLARFIASLSPSMQIDLFNALQGYHEQFYNELVAASNENLARVQGKVQAMSTITITVQKARQIVEAIDNRRNANRVSL